MTWNVRHSTPTGQIVAIVAALVEQHELDAVCLQELTPLSIVPPRTSVHRTLASTTGWDGALAIHPRLYPGWLEGVGILTRLSIVARRRVRLSANRSYVEAVVRHADLGEVCLGCIHLSSPRWRGSELKRAVSRAPQRRYILAGDFNLHQNDPVLRARLPRHSSDGLPGVDHVYVTPDLAVVEPHIESTAASDHDAVIASIEART